MLTAHPTLLIGPADWQPERMPETEFSARIETLWRSVPQAARLFVYGTPRHHAELVYLTNLVPKLEPALALLSRTEPPRLLAGGGANMLGASRPLTWIRDVVPLKALDSVDKSDGALIGGGYMTTAARRAFGGMPDATPHTSPVHNLLFGAGKESNVLVLIDMPEFSKDAYDGIIATMPAHVGSGEQHPAVMHVAGLEPDGHIRVADLWDSEAAFGEFAQTQIGPAAGGAMPPMTPRIVPVYNRLHAQAPATA